MITIAVTGGAACGKSHFCERMLTWAAPGRVSFFSCDAAVSELYREEETIEELKEIAINLNQPELFTGDSLDRALLRELLFENSAFRGKIEELVHPKVLRRVEAHLGALADEVRLSLVEVPLLYEVDFPVSRNLDLVVGASACVQRRRLLELRGLAPRVADRLLRSQLPMADKVRRADIVVWNDGDLESMDAQISHLFRRCENLSN
ncbi:MAG: dephospho-CoA kinase [Verrucomicrobiae bacterium]|nr:dephospho-CoA kinase [Verrucomicrobiae bacterium]